MKHLLVLIFFFSQGAHSTPLLQMNKAFASIFDLGPYLSDENSYLNKKNTKTIQKSLDDLEASFKSVGHDKLIKHDLFAPSYELISENIKESTLSFKNDHKSYSYWILKETLTLCLDCHSRLPQSLTSSFQNGELTFNPSNIKDPYDLGVTYLIVRRFSDAKEFFIRSIQEKIIKKEIHKILLPFQQILMIELKIRKDPIKMVSIIDDYLQKKHLPSQIENELKLWNERLQIWKTDPSITKGIKTEKDLIDFIKRRLQVLKEENSFNDALKVDMLLASGIISEYFFENQNSPSAPDISYWLGWLEKRLKKENFLSTGSLYFKQCIKKYPKSPRSKDCLDEYIESVEFDFSGSRGTAVPSEIRKEIKDLENLIMDKKNKN
jgi:hypothetical protein